MRTIHVHVPRTAGTSMRLWASRNVQSYQSLYRSRGTVFDPAVEWTYMGHSILEDLLRQKRATEDWYYGSFKFAFVRNTWERLVSLYSFHISRKWRQNGRDPSCKYLTSFEKFVRTICLDDEYEGWPVDRHRQLRWLRWGVDFVGRFEQLEEDWKVVCERAEVEHSPLIVWNKTRHRDHREYYTPELAAMVGDFYAEEIEELGYEFG